MAATKLKNRRRSPFKAISKEERVQVRDRAVGMMRSAEAQRARAQAAHQFTTRAAAKAAGGDETKAGGRGGWKGGPIRGKGGKRWLNPDEGRGGLPIDKKKPSRPWGSFTGWRKAPGKGFKQNLNKGNPRYGEWYKPTGEGGSVHKYRGRSVTVGGKGSAEALAEKMAKKPTGTPNFKPAAGSRGGGWSIGGRGRAGLPMMPRPGQAGRRDLPKPAGAAPTNAELYKIHMKLRKRPVAKRRGWAGSGFGPR